MSTQAANVGREKALCFDYLDRNAKAIAMLNDSIFYFAELGMQEIKTAGLMCELLEKGGFKVERGISGFASGFCATCGSGAPVIAIHTEYDANPDNSQASGIADMSVGYGLIRSALVSASFTFHGETAHAGVAPWKGRDALDGVVLMDMGLAQYREHMTPSMRAQRVITNGGDQISPPAPPSR